MIDLATVVTYSSGANPNVLAINSTGAATQDGTEYIAGLINNSIFGPQQAIMDYASLTPDGVTEAAGTAQILDAISLGWGIGPGMGVEWMLNDLPSVTGHRVLMLEGQGVLVASYPLLDAAVWCTDAGPGGSPASGYNAIVAAGGGAYYRASDAAGTTPNIAGPYLILPDMRGYVKRGLDLAAAVDPDGASRFLGDVQGFATQGFKNGIHVNTAVDADSQLSAVSVFGRRTSSGDNMGKSGTPANVNQNLISDNFYSTGHGTPQIKIETRSTNISTKFGITC